MTEFVRSGPHDEAMNKNTKNRKLILTVLLPLAIGFSACGAPRIEAPDDAATTDATATRDANPHDSDYGGPADVPPIQFPDAGFDDAGCCIYCSLFPCMDWCIDTPNCPEGPGCACKRH
jgi:hypothetical protein